MEDVGQKAIESTIRDNQEIVAQWLLGVPKTWGPLAGKAVISARTCLGRNLTEPERRVVWAALWRRLQQIKDTESRA